MRCQGFFAAMVFAALFISHSANAITAEKERDLKALLEVMGVTSMSTDMADMMVTNIIAQERSRYPNMSKEMEHLISNAVYETIRNNASELNEPVFQLYDKYYSHTEIIELNQFFSSPVGRKYSSVLKPMSQDMIEITQKWATKIGPKAAAAVEKAFREHGYE